MKDFSDRLRLTSDQRKEVERYLGSVGVLNEISILKIIRKMKEMERKIEERKYG